MTLAGRPGLRALVALTLAAQPWALSACASRPETLGPAEVSPGASPVDGLPSREVDLAAWGLPSLDALRYARVGVVHGAAPTLVVYHLGADEPAATRALSDATAAPPFSDGRFVIAHYRRSDDNRLGGAFNGFARAPAHAAAAVDAAEGALAFTWRRPAETFAGFWVHLFETTRPPADRVFCDARRARWLTFEVRGAAGGEPIQLNVSDRDAERRQDSAAVGPLAAFLPAGRLTPEWQRAWVPMTALPASIDPARLAGLIFLVDPAATGPSEGRISVRDLALTVTQEAPPPPAASAGAAGAKALRKAMWLWETRRLLAAPGEVERLVAFVETHGFTDLFVQVPYAPPEGEHWSATWDEPGLARLTGALRGAGARTHALDGAAWYARPVWHDRVLATLDQLAAFNARVPPESRLAGVRYDIEPYLLPEFEGRHREKVLRDYVSLLSRIAARTRTAGLELGVDVPFWFDARDEVTGEWAAPLDGGPVSDAIMDIVDNLGLMDYRTAAWGADGVIAHASGELAAAAARGKQVLIGLETVPLPDETLMIYDAGARSRWDVFADLVVEPLDGGRARLTWVPPERRDAEGRYAWAAAGSRLLRHREALHVPAAKITFATHRPRDLDETLAQAREGLQHAPSLAGFIIHSYESFRPWLEASEGRDDADHVGGN